MDKISTFRHVTEHILSQIGDRDGRLSDDHPWSRKELVYMFLRYRSEAILNALNEEGEISDSMRQVLSCIDMEEVPRIDCPCAPPDGCYWLKTVHPIPTPIVIDYITDIRGKEDFTETTWESSKRISKSRIASKRKRRHYLTRENGSGETNIYLLNDSLTPNIRLRGIFFNPLEATTFPSCGKVDKGVQCNPLDVNVFTDINLHDYIFENIIPRLIRNKQVAPSDNLNNDSLDRQETIQNKK